MSTSNLRLTECTINRKAYRDDEYPSFIIHVVLTLKHPQILDPVASLHALRINRDSIHLVAANFLQIMEADSCETREFSSTLFDSSGFAKRHIIEKGSFRSGTGCWGNEVNSGEVIYLKDMDVDEKYRSQGVGSYILKKFLESKSAPKDALVYCWPAPTGRGSIEERVQLQAKQVAFFRKNNFRRVGRTSFFAYSPNPDHPSRLIPAEADAESLTAAFHEANREMSMEEALRNYPLHVAISYIKDTSIASYIQRAYDIDPTSIHKRDLRGSTPLFMAAVHMNAHAISKLLSSGWDMSSDLNDYVNASGATPLEAVVESMESLREFALANLDSWDGHPEDGLQVEYLLKKAMGCEDVQGVRIEEFVVKRKYS